MTRHITRTQLAASKEIVEHSAPRACDDHNFGLPSGIYAAMALLFVGAVAVLASAFSDHMALSYAIVGAFLFAFFAVPAIFVRTSPRESSQAMSWDRFWKAGIETATGHTGAGEATVLALILPVLIFFWAVGVTIIATFVG